MTDGTVLLVSLFGGVCLLLWGVRMVRTGVFRAFGPSLRNTLAACTGNPITAYGAGLGVTGILQSSTATALIVSSFAGRGMITTYAGLALMLGADLGSTLLAQVLSLGLTWLSPIAISGGVIAFLVGKEGKARQLGRVAIGLGLMLLALKLIGDATAPLRASEAFGAILALLSDEALIAVILTAAITWFAHSSLAIVLLVMSLTASGTAPVSLALALVVGINIGGVLAPVVMTARESPEARRIPIGNLMMRISIAAAALLFMDFIAPLIAMLETDPGRQVVNFHTAFNLTMGLVFLPFTAPFARLCAKLIPDVTLREDSQEPRNLDPSALSSPPIALACAVRETLRMGEVVQDMLGRSITALTADDKTLVRDIEEADDEVDRLHEAIKGYVMEFSKNEMDDGESQRMVEVLSFTTNLEHIGDIVDKSLMELASKRIRHRLRFSDDGETELREFHRAVMENLQLALNVFVTRDVEMARKLLEQKGAIRQAELAAARSHYARVGAGVPESVETSGIHMDIISDLKRINGHVASVAYPILEEAGLLRSSRLKKKKADAIVSALSADNVVSIAR